MRPVFFMIVSWFALTAEAADIETDTRACVARAAVPAAILVCERDAQAAWRKHIDVLRPRIEQRLTAEALRTFRQADEAWQRQRLLQLKLLDRLSSSARDDVARMTIEGERTLLVQQRAKHLESLLAILAN